MKGGSLTVVGLGIKSVSQLTLEAASHIRHADKVFFISADRVTAQWVRDANPSAESLNDLYADGKDRRVTYGEMVERILEGVRGAARVCVALYGHPGVFAMPGHEAIRRARAEGYLAEMLPGVSAEDCLFADLGVDPGHHGCQSYEATDFVVRRRRIDPRSHLILWQIGLIGYTTYRPSSDPAGLRVLTEQLSEHYPPGHQVTVYMAARYPTLGPEIQLLPLERLPEARLAANPTLYVPPAYEAEVDDEAALRVNRVLT